MPDPDPPDAVDDLYLFIAVPVVTALVGWGTNWAAVKMIFHPVHFRGIGPFGWQGIIYRAAPLLAAGVGDMVANQLMTPREMADKLDSERVQRFVGEHFDAEGEPLVEACSEAVVPGTWQKLDGPTRQAVLTGLRGEILSLVRDVSAAITNRLPELIDIKAIVVHALSGENAGVLARQMQRVAAKELKFIEYYGGVFGLLIGLLEMVAWGAFQNWWLMPAVGVLVGLITNYMAILMIFRPRQPTRYMGLITYQGLFPKRQEHIAVEYGRSTANEVLTPKNLIDLIGQGEARARWMDAVMETTEERLVALRERAEQLLPVPLDDARQGELRRALQAQRDKRLPAVRRAFEDFLYRELDIERTIQGKLSGLTKAEFEGLLRPLFEQDEWILILVGGVLGGLVGTLQGLTVLAFG